MTRQNAIEKLNVSLTETIQTWINGEWETEGWAEIGYVGDEISRLMAKAAMAVLEGSADVQDSLKADGQLKN